jgi:hypothetical protein
MNIYLDKQNINIDKVAQGFVGGIADLRAPGSFDASGRFLTEPRGWPPTFHSLQRFWLSFAARLKSEDAANF